VDAPLGADGASVEALDDLDPAGQRVVLRLVDLQLDDVLALDALPVACSGSRDTILAPLRNRTCQCGWRAMPLPFVSGSISVMIRLVISRDSTASTRGRRWFSSGAVSSMSWSG
jgi:hypothetical protein